MKSHLSASMGYWVSTSFIVRAWPAVTCLSERYFLLWLSRFYVQVISVNGMYFLYRNFICIQAEWLQEFETHEEFLLFSCSCPLLTLAQHCKGKQIPTLKSRPKPDRKTVVLSCVMSGGKQENGCFRRHFSSPFRLENQRWASTRRVALFEHIKFSWMTDGLQKESPSRHTAY